MPQAVNIVRHNSSSNFISSFAQLCSISLCVNYCNIYQAKPVNMSAADPVVIETGNRPDAAVILLHGLGADGNDFVPIVEQLQLAGDYAIRFIFPHAPLRPISINQGYRMPGWYDIRSLSFGEQEDVAGILESSNHLKQLCGQQQALGIPADRIILAGFSQGGAIALHCGCRYPHTLAGIMALSTYVPLADTLADEKSDNATKSPVFMAHGRQDDIVAFHYGKHSMTLLRENNFVVDWHEYDMGHSVCMEEIRHIRQWLTRLL
jgi:phospholipase/carboxylesterase